ncbi:hypothetical protein MSG28_005398 [Choristoneura fumiferana]|uniref:Uncharacterized protein n=1 Tax=Choristoneura fumiferana TaxID=7141 RepID=A0ACC0JR82_CHOFU|nr:hypothetical protein MSG28_005398 [Choristoneura fumiferana]
MRLNIAPVQAARMREKPRHAPDVRTKTSAPQIYFYSDDLVKIAGSRWMRKAQDRSEWRALGEAYVQQWTSFG